MTILIMVGPKVIIVVDFKLAYEGLVTIAVLKGVH